MKGFPLLSRQLHFRPVVPRTVFRSVLGTTRQMSSQREDSIPHELRTAAEPRQNRLYPVRLSHVEQANASVRLLHLTLPAPSENMNNDHQQPFTFLPGQWLDVYIPSISQAGGFTITSTPADAQELPAPDTASGDETSPSSVEPHGRAPYVELAVQESPSNPSAAWLWRPKEEILGKELNIRVGGSFVWPPAGIDLERIKNVVFIAGGVGINPLISILAHLNNNLESQSSTIHHPCNIHFLYSSRLPQQKQEAQNAISTSTSTSTTTTSADPLDQILFLPRLRQIISSQLHSHRLRISLDLFLTNNNNGPSTTLHHLPISSPPDLTIHSKRISEQDLRAAILGGDEKRDPRCSVCYICGPPGMTDEMVEVVRRVMLDDDAKERVFFEKWW